MSLRNIDRRWGLTNASLGELAARGVNQLDLTRYLPPMRGMASLCNRVIAASNRDLQRTVTEGSFREDLFYRLRVFDIYIPPLRERRSDIPLLSDAFLENFSRSTGCSSAGLTSDAREMLLDYEWPGNVRELHNALERAAILCEGGPITAEHLSLRGPGFAAPRRRANLPDVERRTIEQALHETAWNKSKAARRLGITRTQLYGRLRKYGLEWNG